MQYDDWAHTCEAAMELHGRQFLARLDAEFPPALKGRTSFGALPMGFHPQLPVTEVAAPECAFLALGHIVDPAHPTRTNEDVLRTLLRCRSYAQVEAELFGLGGRWLLFAQLGEDRRLYPDAVGSKSAFYSADAVASQPGLLGCRTDDGLDAYPDACAWPMGETPFEGIRQLLPNHYLDLRTFRAVRFGPRSPEHTDLAEGVRVIGEILAGTVAALTHRGSVSLSLTGGYDSRTILSAAYDVRERLDLFTVVDDETPRHDYVIPRELARRSGQPLRFVRPELEDDIRPNTCGLWRDENQRRLSAFGQPGIVLLGHASEILRCFYWRDGVRRPVSPALLSKLSGFRGSHTGAFARWIGDVPSDTAIDLLDLFYWESRAGVWSSLCCTALDGYADVVSPYNNRRLIEVGLGVDVDHRRAPYELHRRLCRPEFRSVPFNTSRLERWYAALPEWLPWRVRMMLKRLTRVGT